jgi:hypothetical protein
MFAFTYPDSLIITTDPGGMPHSNSDFLLTRLKIQYGGKKLPSLLELAVVAVVSRLSAEVCACTFLPHFIATALSGMMFNWRPLSSTLWILPGLLRSFSTNSLVSTVAAT